MLRSIGKQSVVSVESVQKKKKRPRREEKCTVYDNDRPTKSPDIAMPQVTWKAGISCTSCATVKLLTSFNRDGRML